MDGKDKHSILNKLTKMMCNNGSISKNVSKSIFEREVMASTDIGNLLAIPHPIENDMEESNVGICILDNPILWNDERVQIIFVISIAKKDISIWEPLFLGLFKYLIDMSGISKLIKYKDIDIFKSDLKKVIKGELSNGY